MNPDEVFRRVLILDRWQEDWFILLTLRPIGLAGMSGFLAYLIDPTWMRCRFRHTLVSSGPYRWVRHPFYDAVALTTVGHDGAVQG
jgi:protein-S-isoprenylcysteine O-methyltransferase Ste14